MYKSLFFFLEKMNCKTHDINLGFSKTDATEVIYLKDVQERPQDIVNYMANSPNCTRETGDWRWCAPNEICRQLGEPGFAFASLNMGMGHVHMLMWLHKTGHWDVVHLGGANDYERQDIHNAWLKHDGLGVIKTVQTWMKELSSS
jgi:hypothetical protein